MSRSWTSEQQAILESWGEGISVLAGAGSGKTTTLVEKCRRLVERCPSARFAAVSFTEKSAYDLKNQLALALPTLRPHRVSTIHGLFSWVLEKTEGMNLHSFSGRKLLSPTESSDFWSQEVLENPSFFEGMEEDFDFWIAREGQSGLHVLLTRIKELSLFGVLEILDKKAEDSRGLARFGRQVLQKYQEWKRLANVMDFQDLEAGVGEVLSKKKNLFDFDLLLIDEFQDTNLLQAQLLWKLARPDLSNLCVVGDPKQSIYRFRDADVSVFDAYRMLLPRQLSLSVNFRSHPELLSQINSLCQKIFAASQLPFEALQPPPFVANKERNESDPPRDILKLDVEGPLAFAQWILSQKNSVPLQESVLLMRQIRGNEPWIEGIQASGIPCVVESGGFFWSEPVVRECVAFLKWWDHPAAYAHSGAVFLRSPWMEIPDFILNAWVQVDPSWRVPFFNSTHPVALLLREYQGCQTLSPGDLLQLLFSVLKGRDPGWDECLLSLWHRVEAWTEKGWDFHRVVLACAQAIERDRREPSVPVPLDFEGLKILSIHGAKGLEFSQVFLFGFENQKKRLRMPLLFWAAGKKDCFLSPRTEGGERDWKGSEAKNWREEETQRSLEESKRLFYVALTRAKERLILVCPSSLSSEEERKKQFDSDSLQEDFWRGWIHQIFL